MERNNKQQYSDFNGCRKNFLGCKIPSWREAYSGFRLIPTKVIDPLKSENDVSIVRNYSQFLAHFHITQPAYQHRPYQIKSQKKTTKSSSGNSNSCDRRVETVRKLCHGARAPKSSTKYPWLKLVNESNVNGFILPISPCVLSGIVWLG